ncbi:MAG: hypothetical protein AAF726_19675 [Planctomycetota bacterium]
MNSTGRPARLRLTGSLSIAENRLLLVGNEVPESTWVLPIAGTIPVNVPMVGGSTGTLCVGGSVRRLAASIARADAGGAYDGAIDLTVWHPGPSPTAQPGETWHFQLWFRDSGPTGVTSNFSDAVEVTYQ